MAASVPLLQVSPSGGAKDGDSAESSHGIHKLLTLAKCPRLYAYRYILGLRKPFDSVAISLGTTIHAGLEEHYKGGNWLDAMRSFSRKPEFAHVVERAKNILKNYFVKYKGEKLHVISVEREYEILVQGFKFTRRLDLVYESEGRLYIVDHKTASDPRRRTGQSELDATLMSQELIGRVVFERVHGYKYGGSVLNLIPTGTGGLYSRYPLRFPPRMVEDMPRSLARYLSWEARLLKEGMSPWEYTQNWDSCYTKYGVCDYWQLCAQGADALEEFNVK